MLDISDSEDISNYEFNFNNVKSNDWKDIYISKNISLANIFYYLNNYDFYYSILYGDILNIEKKQTRIK